MKKKIIVSLLLVAIFAFAGAVTTVKSVRAEEVGAPDCNAKAAMLLDADTGTVVYEKNATQRLQIASMVKIMTLNLIFEEIEKGNLSYDTEVTASEYATSMGGSQAFLDTNNKYKVSELVKSIIVASANDSCVAMAEHIAGSVPTFVEKMNAKAASLGMNDTYFVNCTGLPAPNQYCCAKDVASMTKELIKHKDFFEFSKIWMFDFVHPSGRVTGLSNTNKLIRYYDGCDGGKTGFTSEALSCLSATAKRGDTRFLCVVVGAESSKVRNAEVSKLFNYGFANFETKRFVSKGDVVEERVTVKNGKTSDAGVCVAQDIVLFGAKGSNKNCTVEKEFFECTAPLKVGDKVGEVKVLCDGNVLATADLLSTEEVKNKGYLDIIDEFIEKW